MVRNWEELGRREAASCEMGAPLPLQTAKGQAWAYGAGTKGPFKGP